MITRNRAMFVEQLVGSIHGEDLLDQHLEHVGEYLEDTQGPTRIGPRRRWNQAHTLRSMKISTIAMRAYAVENADTHDHTQSESTGSRPDPRSGEADCR